MCDIWHDLDDDRPYEEKATEEDSETWQEALCVSAAQDCDLSVYHHLREIKSLRTQRDELAKMCKKLMKLPKISGRIEYLEHFAFSDGALDEQTKLIQQERKLLDDAQALLDSLETPNAVS